MKDFRKLQVWKRAHVFTLDLYQETVKFPREEIYGLVSQIRRATVSIPSNIAEGCGRQGDAELARFLQIAMGSASEVEYQLLLAKDLNYLGIESYNNLNQQLVKLRRMLNAFLQKLKANR